MLHRPHVPWTCFLLLILCLAAGCSGEEKARLQVGDRAPGFTTRDITGKTVSMEQLAGHPLILRFFLIDCKFCRADTAILNDFYSRYRDRGLQIVYIESIGVPEEDLKRFVHDLDIRFPVVREKGAELAALYSIRSLPLTVVIDADQKIIGAILGGISEGELNRLLGPWLQAGGQG